MESFRERLLRRFLPAVGYAYIRLLHRTMRLEFRNREVLERTRRDAGAYILGFWHSRFVMMPYCYPGERIVVLVSRHRDAMMLTSILQRFGLETAHGSSTAGGAQGLRDLLRKVRRGFDVGVTPDGPRGPRRKAKAGVVAAAKLSGLPVIPVAFSARPARRLRSWDRTLLPFPFARGLFVYGEPIEVPRDADEDQAARLLSEIEAAIDEVTDRADRDIGLGLEPPRDPVESG